MARVATHLSVSELERHYRAAKDATAARHYQAIWLLAKGHRVPEVAEMTSFGARWLEQLLSRYNARGPTALGDQRRHNGWAPTILKPELLERLKPRLKMPPADGGLWTGPKVAVWMAGALGLEKVTPQRGWEALRVIGWTIQVQRARGILKRRPRKSGRRLKKARRGGRGGSRARPGEAHRGLRQRRAPARSEAVQPALLGAARRAPSGPRAPSLRVALQSPPSSRLRAARPSGTSPTVSPRRSSRNCSRSSPAKPVPETSVSSFW